MQRLASKYHHQERNDLLFEINIGKKIDWGWGNLTGSSVFGLLGFAPTSLVFGSPTNQTLLAFLESLNVGTEPPKE